MKTIAVVLLYLAACGDNITQEPIVDFGELVTCYGEHADGTPFDGIFVDHGYRALERLELEYPQCQPACDRTPGLAPCPVGVPFYTIPIRLSDDSSGNACFCYGGAL